MPDNQDEHCINNHLLENFRVVPPSTREASWFGPYTALLARLFPEPEGYLVVPQFYLFMRSAIDFGVTFRVDLNETPVFFLELKPEGDFADGANREAADDQMHQRFGQLISKLEVPMLYGISAFGTRFAVYMNKKDSKTINPRALERDKNHSLDVAPETWWCHDILLRAGRQEIKQIAEHVHAMAKIFTPLFVRIGLSPTSNTSSASPSHVMIS